MIFHYHFIIWRFTLNNITLSLILLIFTLLPLLSFSISLHFIITPLRHYFIIFMPLSSFRYAMPCYWLFIAMPPLLFIFTLYLIFLRYTFHITPLPYCHYFAIIICHWLYIDAIIFIFADDIIRHYHFFFIIAIDYFLSLFVITSLLRHAIDIINIITPLFHWYHYIGFHLIISLSFHYFLH